MRRITLNPEKKLAALGDLYGIFFEDLNHAADGGLYGQMVQNYAFEYCAMDNPSYRAMTAWEVLEAEDTVMSAAVLCGDGFSRENPHYLTVEVKEPGKQAGFFNLGYNTGLYFEKGKSYRFSCYARREGKEPVTYTVALGGIGGETYGKGEICISDDKWCKYELELTAQETDTAGRLYFMTKQAGRASFDFISLFPKDTFKERENGLRRDIAELLAEMRPKFVRFPGGCLVHDGSLDENDRDSMYRWKKTIGPVENRPARRNNWNYNQSLGLGFYEYFLFCEDIGAKPLPVLPAGYNPHSRQSVPEEKLQEWIDDALDLIAFANDGADTKWGSIRAGLGHEEPFGLEYLAIGNEEEGEGFFRLYPFFHKAIKEKYPEIKLINSAGPFTAGREFDCGWKSAYENQSELVDEHYYTSPEWMLANVHRYDSYNPAGPKVFLGEYASWGNTYYNALCEAAYMTGLERNAASVGLACYAPLLCNADYVNWQPDMIWFDNHRVYGMANYYVQKLFMNHQGDSLIEMGCEGMEVPVTVNAGAIRGDIAFGASGGAAEFTKIEWTDHISGRTVCCKDIQIAEGEKEQRLQALNGEALPVSSEDYTLHFYGKRRKGRSGLTVSFGIADEKNRYEWAIGSWDNKKTELVSVTDGRSSSLTQERLHLLDGVTYECTLHVKGREMTGLVAESGRDRAEEGQQADLTKVSAAACRESAVLARVTAQDLPLVLEDLYTVASLEEETGDVILKVVNVQEQEREADICLQGRDAVTVYSLAGYEKEAVNSFEQPEKILPREETFPVEGNSFRYCFPAQSVTVLRFRKQ